MPLTEPMVSASPGDNAIAHLEHEWQLELIETLLTQLEPSDSKNHRILIMHFRDGATVLEIAAALQLSSQQVRGRKKRLLAKLRTRLALYTGDHIGKSSR